MNNMKKINLIRMIVLFLGLFTLFLMINAVSSLEATSCCEKTKSGFYCQNAPQEECNTNFRSVPSACESTSYCSLGVCYDPNQGTCTGNTPQIVCNQERNGTWFATAPEQCNLGCCVLGDQAAFVSLVRCKKLSGFLGLETNYNKEITNEVSCVLSVSSQDTGACVYESDFERTCKFTTRANCNSLNLDDSAREFYKGKLCTDPELNTICGKTTETICLPGKDGVYFKDTCGNPANIYDSSKINDIDYWTNVKTSLESCNPASDNSNSKSCGNCNYLLGSFCRDSRSAGSSASYGDNICANLNCKNTQNGNSYRHGESWCVYTDAGKTGVGNNAVGSEFYKHICVNGEEIVESCAGFRQEECIQDEIVTSLGVFSQAACRVNRWQDCTAQTSEIDCLNTDKRDCLWKPDLVINSSSNKQGVCVPKNSPGLQFWNGDDAQSICAQANAQCIVTFEKGLFGGEECVSNCECLKDSWVKQRNDLCMSLGDCGPKINWQGQLGYKIGYNVTLGKPKSGGNK